MVRKYAKVWLKPLIKLNAYEPVKLRYEIKANKWNSEVISAFSYNKKPWKTPNMDAFTWFAAAHRKDFTFRTKMFAGFPRVAKRNTFKLKVGQWYTMDVSLTTK